MSQWQPQNDPRQQRPVTPPQWQQAAPPRQDPQYRPQYQPQYQQPHRAPEPRRGYAIWAAAALVLLAVAGAAFYVLHGRGSSPGSTAQAASQPETEAGVRSAANRFYALYSAGQWAQAWQMLTPATQRTVPESTFVAVHQSCTSSSAGLARAIKSVTMAGSTAVVTEGLAGAASALASVTDTWKYADGRWGIALSPSNLKDYTHGSTSADVAAMKAAGLCAS